MGANELLVGSDGKKMTRTNRRLALLLVFTVIAVCSVATLWFSSTLLELLSRFLADAWLDRKLR